MFVKHTCFCQLPLGRPDSLVETEPLEGPLAWRTETEVSWENHRVVQRDRATRPCLSKGPWWPRPLCLYRHAACHHRQRKQRSSVCFDLMAMTSSKFQPICDEVYQLCLAKLCLLNVYCLWSMHVHAFLILVSGKKVANRNCSKKISMFPVKLRFDSSIGMCAAMLCQKVLFGSLVKILRNGTELPCHVCEWAGPERNRTALPASMWRAPTSHPSTKHHVATGAIGGKRRGKTGPVQGAQRKHNSRSMTNRCWKAFKATAAQQQHRVITPFPSFSPLHPLP